MPQRKGGTTTQPHAHNTTQSVDSRNRVIEGTADVKQLLTKYQYVLRLRGVPREATQSDVAAFIAPEIAIKEEQVVRAHAPNGESLAFLLMPTREQAEVVMAKKDKKPMGTKYIEVHKFRRQDLINTCETSGGLSGAYYMSDARPSAPKGPPSIPTSPSSTSKPTKTNLSTTMSTTTVGNANHNNNNGSGVWESTFKTPTQKPTKRGISIIPANTHNPSAAPTSRNSNDFPTRSSGPSSSSSTHRYSSSFVSSVNNVWSPHIEALIGSVNLSQDNNDKENDTKITKNSKKAKTKAQQNGVKADAVMVATPAQPSPPISSSPIVAVASPVSLSLATPVVGHSSTINPCGVFTPRAIDEIPKNSGLLLPPYPPVPFHAQAVRVVGGMGVEEVVRRAEGRKIRVLHFGDGLVWVGTPKEAMRVVGVMENK